MHSFSGQVSFPLDKPPHFVYNGHKGGGFMWEQDVFSLARLEENSRFSPGDRLVLLTFDDNYVDQSINLILSIARYHPQGVSFVCVCPPLGEENRRTLLGLSQGIQLRCYDCREDFSTGRWVSGAVLRLFCPWLLEEEYHRILYMDSDILCTGSLEALFSMEVPLLAMCSEISGNVSPSRLTTVRPWLPTQIYCNSGVVLFNLDALRQRYSFRQVYEALLEWRGKFTYLDQDFLNVFFQGEITVLNPFFFNCQAYELRKTEFWKLALRQCSLIHYSVGKPWVYKTRLKLIRLYLKHSLYPPMTRRVRRTYVLSLLYSPIRIARRIASHAIHFFD